MRRRHANPGTRPPQSTGLPDRTATAKLPLAGSCRLRVMDRPVSDYPDDVTVYLVVDDFGKLAKPTSRQTSPKLTARQLSAISFPGNTATLSVSSPSIPPRAGRGTCRRTSRTRCWSALSMPTTISPRTRSASSIGTSPRARNGRRRPRCGAVTIRPFVRKLELRIKIIAATWVGACGSGAPWGSAVPWSRVERGGWSDPGPP